MNPEIKKQWVQALRDYSLNPGSERHRSIYHSSLKSIAGKLAVDGILCQLYIDSHQLNWEGKNKLELFGTTHAIPKKVQEWAGLRTHDPILKSAPDKFLFRVYKKPTLNIVATTAQKQVGEAWAGLTYNDVADLIEADL